MTAPVVISSDAASFTREHYEMGHVSKFVRPGAVRIGSTDLDSVSTCGSEHRRFKGACCPQPPQLHHRPRRNTDASHHFARYQLPPDGIVAYTW